MAMFEDTARNNRLQEAASAWQQSNPRFQQILDQVSRLMYSTPAVGLDPSTRGMMSALAATAQNSIPGMGTPVSDFVGVNRALINRGVPMYTMNAEGQLYALGTSYGTGNVSVAATTQLMQSFEKGMYSGTTLDIGKTHGLSQTTRSQFLADFLQTNGVGQGIHAYDLSQARTANDIGQAIAGLKGTKKFTDASFKSLEDVQKAVTELEKTPDGEKNGAAGMSEVSIAAALNEKGYDSTTIKQTIAQVKGKNTNFLVQTKELEKNIQDAFDAVGDNIKSLSNLFQTEDLNQLKSYAKALGMDSITSAESAASVRSEMRRIATISDLTGRSPQEVAAEYVQISSGMSSMYGGRAASSGLISTVFNAGVAPGMSGNSGIFTKEAAQSAAMRSVANSQNMMEGAIVARAAMEHLGGNVSEATRQEYAQLAAKRDAAYASGDYESVRAIDRQMQRFAVRNFGEQVNSTEFKEMAFAKYSEEDVAGINNARANRNISEETSKFARRMKLSKGQRSAMESTMSQLLDTFGNDEMARTSFMNTLASAGPEAAINELINGAGLSKEEATRLVSSVNAAGGVGMVNQASMMLNARWVQQFAGRAQQRKLDKQESIKIANGFNLTSADGYSSSAKEFMAGFLKDGGITDQNAADLLVADAFRGKKATENISVDGLLTLGKIDQNTGKFVMSDAELTSLAEKTGIAKADLSEMSAAQVRDALERSGYMLSSSRDNKDRHVAVARDNVKKQQEAYNKEVADAGLDAVAKVMGEDALVYGVQGKDKTTGWGFMYEGEAYDKKGLINQLSKGSKGYSKLTALAEAGDKDAKDALHNKHLSVLTPLLGKDTADKKAGADKQLDSNEFMAAIKEQFGTTNTRSFGSIEYMMNEGLISKTDDGKYVIESDELKKNHAGNKATLDEKELKALMKKVQEKAKGATALLDELSGNDKRPPSYEQMDQLLSLLRMRD